MKDQIPQLREQLHNPTLFKQIYQFAFDLGRQENQKSLRTYKGLQLTMYKNWTQQQVTGR
jgi:hypothetical protein